MRVGKAFLLLIVALTASVPGESPAPVETGVVFVIELTGDSATEQSLAERLSDFVERAFPRTGTHAVGMVPDGPTAAETLPLTPVTEETLTTPIAPAFLRLPAEPDDRVPVKRFEGLRLAKAMLSHGEWQPGHRAIVYVVSTGRGPDPALTAEITDSGVTDIPIFHMLFSPEAEDFAAVCPPPTQLTDSPVLQFLMTAFPPDVVAANLNCPGPSPGPSPGCSCGYDGNACTYDYCISGVCHKAVTCNSDNNVCTSDACNTSLGCNYPPVSGNPSCNDNSLCTVNDTCSNGQCLGQAVTCNDGNACTVDTCNPATGCVFTQCCGLPDCNNNGWLDSCDLQAGTATDLNQDGILDECEPDVDANGYVRHWATLWPWAFNYDLSDRLATGCGFNERNMEPSVGDMAQGWPWDPHYGWDLGGGVRGVNFEGIPLIQGLDGASAYAHTYVYVPSTRDARAVVVADDIFELYVDGMLWANQTQSPTLELSQGWHRVMVQVANGYGDSTWQFALRFDNGSGQLYTDLSATPHRHQIDPDQGIPVPTDPAARPPAILDWLVLGPLDNNGCDVPCPLEYSEDDCVSVCTSGVDILAQSTNGLWTEAYAAPTAGAAVEGTGLSWSTLRASLPINFSNYDTPVDLNQYFGFDGASPGQMNQSAYLHTYVMNSGDQAQARVTAAGGSAITVWIGGLDLLSSCACEPSRCLLDNVSTGVFTLPPGVSRLLVRVDGTASAFSGWGARISMVDGGSAAPLAAVAFSPNPPAASEGQPGDCDNDGVTDAAEIAAGSPDCNSNDIPDSCDLRDGTSPDCNGDGIPSECGPDCDADGLPSECENDCDHDDVPDDCDLGADDCNGVTDECEQCSGPEAPFLFDTATDFTNLVDPGYPPAGPHLWKIDATSDPGRLRIAPLPAPNNVIWVACSHRGTVVKIDTETGTVLGEYRTAPKVHHDTGDASIANPSRTTVDLNGNVWVANRNVQQQCSGDRLQGTCAAGRECGSVVRINDTCFDRNSNGFVTSSGMRDIRDWNGADITGAIDDCIMLYTLTAGTGTRALAVDYTTNDLWVGSYDGYDNPADPLDADTYSFEKLNGVTGSPIPGTLHCAECGGYGGLIDRNGVLWFVAWDTSASLMRFDPNASGPNAGPCCIHGVCLQNCGSGVATAVTLSPCMSDIIEYLLDEGEITTRFNTADSTYGIALDPITGNIVVSQSSTGGSNADRSVQELSATAFGKTLKKGPGFNGQGVAVDANGTIWVAELNGSAVRRFTRNATAIVPVGTGSINQPAPNCVRIPVAPNGNQGQAAPAACSMADSNYWLGGTTGIAVDRAGKVWVTERYANRVSRIDPNAGGAGAIDLQVELGGEIGTPPRPIGHEKCEPYNYSDMTGFQLLAATAGATWSVVLAGPAAATNWSKVTWVGDTSPPGTSIVVEVRAGDSHMHLSSKAFTSVASGQSFANTRFGAYLEVRVTLEGPADPFATPTLDSIRIEYECPDDCDGEQGWDYCQILADPGVDANGNGILDECENPLVASARIFGVDDNGNILDGQPEILATDECALVGLDATASQGNIERYEWDLDGGGFAGGGDVYGEQLLYAWDVDASGGVPCLSGQPDCQRKSVTLRVVGEGGQQQLEDVAAIDVRDTELTASDIRIEGLAEAAVGEPACFRALINESCDHVQVVHWDSNFNAGTQVFVAGPSGDSQCFTWGAPGVKNVAVRVTEDDENATEVNGSNQSLRPVVWMTVNVGEALSPFVAQPTQLAVEARLHAHDPFPDQSGYLAHRAQLRVVNHSQLEVDAPVYVAFANLTPPQTAVLNDLSGPTSPLADQNLPHIEIPVSGFLAPGQASDWVDAAWFIRQDASGVFSYEATGYSGQLPPVFSSDPKTQATEGEPYAYEVVASDPEMRAVRYDFAPSSDRPENMFLGASSGVLSWTPDQQAGTTQGGQYFISIRAGDSYAGSYTDQPFVISVSKVNVPPRILTEPPGDAVVGTPYSYLVDCVDLDGETPRLGAALLPSWLTFTDHQNGTGTLEGTPDTGGAFTIELFAADPSGVEAVQRFQVSVGDCNEPPILASDTGLQVEEGRLLTHQVRLLPPVPAALDPHFYLDSAPDGMTIDAATGLIQWQPSFRAGNTGQGATALVRVENDAAIPEFCVDTQRFDIAVLDRNTRPQLKGLATSYSATEGQPFSLLLSADDEDGDIPSFTLGQAPPGMTVDPWYGLVQWTPSQTAALGNPYNILIQATDRHGGFMEVSVGLTVTAVNVPPQIDSSAVTYAIEDALYSHPFVAHDDDGETATLQYFVTTNAPAGLTGPMQIAGGNLTWHPDPTAARQGPYHVLVTVQDAAGETATQEFDLTVYPTNSPPTIDFSDCAAQAAGLQEGDDLDCYVAVADPDNLAGFDQDLVTFSLTGEDCGAPPAGMHIGRSSGRLTWQVPYDLATPSNTPVAVAVPIRVADGFTTVEPPTCIDIVVQQRLQPPAITEAPPYTAYVGAAYSFGLTAESADALPGQITFAPDDTPAGMNVSLGGAISWTPTAGDLGVHPVVIRAWYTAGVVVESFYSFRIQVLPVNTRPAFGSNHVLVQSATPDTVYATSVLVIDPDPVQPLTYELVQGPPGTSFGPDPSDPENDRKRVVTWDRPQPPDLGTHLFALRVNDGIAWSELWWAVAVSTDGQNTPPRFTSDPITEAVVAQPYEYPVTVVDADASLDVLTVVLTTAPLGMAYDVATRKVVWADPQLGTHDVAIYATDGRGGAAWQRFLLTVSESGENRPPEILSLPPLQHNAQSPSPFEYAVFAVDPDGDPLTYVLLDAPAGMTIGTPDPWVIRWSPPSAQVGSHFVNLQVDDGLGGSYRQFFTLVVYDGAPNTAPRIVSTPRTTAKIGEAYVYAVDAVDAEQQAAQMDFILLESPPNMAMEAGALDWIPQPDQVGTHFVTVAVSDQAGGWAEQRFSVVASISGRNQGPQFVTTPPQTADVGREYRYRPVVYEPEGATVTFSLEAAPAGMTVDPAGGLVRWMPLSGQIGTHTISLRADDPMGGSAVQTWDLAAAADGGNSPPRITSSPPLQALVGSGYTYDVEAVDPDGDTVEFALLTAPVGVTLDSSSGQLTWPTGLTAGCHELGVRAHDDNGGVDEQRFVVTVSADGRNRAPRIISTPPSRAVLGQPYRYELASYDSDGDSPLTYEFDRKPAGAQIVDEGGLKVILWTPLPAQNGLNYFTLLVHDRPDGSGGCGRQEWRVTASRDGRNNAPKITSQPILRTLKDELYTYQVEAIDPDGNELTFSKVHPDAIPMTIDPTTGVVQWTPAIDSLYAIRIVASDEHGASDEQYYELDVSVGTFRTRPRIVSQPTTKADPAGYTYPVAAVHDLEAMLAYGKLPKPTPPAGIGFVGNVLTWTGPLSVGCYPIGIRVWEENDLSSWVDQFFSITISPGATNVAPRIVSDPIRTAVAGRVYRYPVGVEDDDGPANVTPTVVDGPFTMDFGTGPDAHVLIWDTAAFPPGSYEVKIKAEDAELGWSTQFFNLQVVPDQPPNITSDPVVTVLVPQPDAPPPACNPPTAGEEYVYQVEATDPDSISLRYCLETDASGLAIDASGRITWPFSQYQSQVGKHPVAVIVTDCAECVDGQGCADCSDCAACEDCAGGLSDRQEFVLEVIDVLSYDLHKPQVTVIADPFVVGSGNSVFIDVTAVDDTGILHANGTRAIDLAILDVANNGQETLIESQTLALDADGRASYTFTPPGPGGYIARALAQDMACRMATARADFFVPVADADADPAFDLTITSPALDSTVDDAAIPIHGRAISENFFKYTLAYRAMGEESFTEFHTSFAIVGNYSGGTGPLGTLDATQLQNGTYQIRLRGFDAGGYVLDGVTQFSITNRAKVGNLQLAFTDLSLVVGGLPVTVTRSYDSRNKRDGDFGFGWTLDISTMKLEENTVMGGEWFVYDGGLQCYASPAGARYITVTWPDDRTEVFQFTYQSAVGWSGGCGGPFQVYGTGFDAVAPATSFLTASGASGLMISSQSPNLTTTGDIDDPPWDPSTYTLTAADGTRYEFRKAPGSRSALVERVVDRNGNTITFRADGIQRSGPGLPDAWAVRFSRDSHGRIVEIKDAQAIENEANGDFTRGTLRYVYDQRGDLVRFTSRTDDLTRFEYNDKHGMTEIIGPDGRPLAHNVYDDSGRLIAHVDADGNRIDYCRDDPTECPLLPGCQRQEVVFGRSVNGVRSSTYYCYDEDGNVTVKQETVGGAALLTRFEYDGSGNLTKTWLPDDDPNDGFVPYTERTYDDRANVLTDRDMNGNVTTFTYNADNTIKTITDPRGHQTSHEYDGKGNLTKVIRHNPAGADEVTSYTYDPKGNRLTEKDPLGRVTVSEYFPDGQLKKTTDPLGNATEYLYDANGNVVQETRRRFRKDLDNPDTAPPTEQLMVTTYFYDDSDRLVLETDALGRETLTTYNTLGKPETVTSVFGQEEQVVAYEYDLRGNLFRTTYPDLSTSESEYDEEGRQVRTTDRDGNVTTFKYDELGRLTHTYVPDETPGMPFDGPYTRTVYDALGRVKERFDERGSSPACPGPIGRTEYRYEPNKQTVIQWVTENAQLVSIETESQFDAVGNLVLTRDNLGRITEYEYDYAGRLTKTIFPALSGQGGVRLYTTTAYDLAGRKIAERDQAGRETRYEYDALGRLIKVVNPLIENGSPGQTTYEYDQVGNLISQTDAEDHVTRMWYDNLGNVTERRLPEGQLESFVYDDAGRLYIHTNFDNEATTYAYDSNGRLETTTLPGPVVIAYDYTPSGLRTQAGGPSRGVGGDRYLYDERGRLELETKENQTDTLLYGYDCAGNRTSLTVTSPTGTAVTTYTFDELNRLTSVTDGALGVPTVYQYDEVGNRKSVAYPNGTLARYHYDEMNRLTRLFNYPTTAETNPLSDHQYELGPAGNRTKLTERDGQGQIVREVTYRYDDLYRLTHEIEDTPDQANLRTVAFTYDRVGNRRTETVETETGTQTTKSSSIYLYDDNDRLQSRAQTEETLALAAPATQTRFAQAPASSWAKPALAGYGLLTIGLGLLPFLPYRSRRGRRARSFRRSTLCIAWIMVPLMAVGPEHVYALHLEAQARAALSQAAAAGALSFTTSVNWTYGYDGNGNMTSRTQTPSSGLAETDFYDYDDLNRLIVLRHQIGVAAPSVQADYAYDADGIRTLTNDYVGGNSARYLTDKNQPYAQVVEERAPANGVLIARYTYGDDLIAQTRTGQRYYYHYDGQLSTRLLTNAAGALTNTYTFDAFGNTLSSGGPSPVANNYLYTGEQYDPNLEFYYLRARYYDQRIARFLTADSFVGSPFEPQSLHKYTYAHNSPISNWDPSGHSPIGSVGSLLIGIAIQALLLGIVFGAIGYAFARIRGLTHDEALQEAWVSGGFGALLAIPYVGAVVGFLGLASVLYQMLTGRLDHLDYLQIAAYLAAAALLRRPVRLPASQPGAPVPQAAPTAPAPSAQLPRLPARGRAPEYKGGRVTENQVLDLAMRWLGPGYRESSPGRFISADGTRQFRLGRHEFSTNPYHAHFEAYNMAGGRVIENTRVDVVP